MTKRKNEIVNIETIDNLDVDTTEEVQEIKTPIFLQEKCIVKTTNADIIGFYFKNYGISLKTNKHYNIGDEITVNYKSDIGKPDFEY